MNEMLFEFPEKSFFGSLKRKRIGLVKEKRELKRKCHDNVLGHSYFIDKNGKWCEEPESYRVKRLWRGQRSKQIKRICNRKFRRLKYRYLTSTGRNIHKKCTEFWWEYD